MLKGSILGSLPEDLKREILEITAYLYPRLAPRLILVSRDVQHWIEHVIYREVYFNGQRLFQRSNGGDGETTLQKFKRTMDARPSAFFAEHVKALHFDGTFDAAEILPIIKTCSTVTNFGCYARLEGDAKGEIYQAIHALSLERLFISQENLNGLLEAEAPPTGSLLHNTTHLAVVDGWNYPARRFPSLTHIALVPDAEEKFAPQVHSALAQPQIVSIVIMLNYATALRQNAALQGFRVIADPRMVNFTLPLSERRFIEDDLWDLAMTFPDEEQPIAYLETEPYPKILSFEELKALGLHLT